MSIPFEKLAVTRLSDLANQIYEHTMSGNLQAADLLKEEGAMLAKALDSGEDFFFAPYLVK